MKPDEIAHLLSEVGMGPDEAAVFVHLCRAGPCRATELAQRLRYSRPRAYRALDALAHHGFVTLGVGRPRLYAAAPPATVFQALRSRAEWLGARVQRIEEQATPELQRLAGRADAAPVAGFTVVRGMDALFNQAHGLYAEARRGIDLLFTNQGGRELFGAVDETSLLAKRAREGLDVRLMVRSDPMAVASWAVSERLPNVAIRVVDTDVLSTFILTDGREAMVFVTADAEARSHPERAIGFRTDAVEFVAMQGLLFDRLWETAQPMLRGRRDGKARRDKAATPSRT